MAAPRRTGNPFTNPDSPALQHANANAAFMRETAPGGAGDFTHSGEPHRHEPTHPDADLTDTPNFLGPPVPKARKPRLPTL